VLQSNYVSQVTKIGLLPAVNLSIVVAHGYKH
jgi:hypothetical protein